MKKIYQIIMMCAMSFALVGCSIFEKDYEKAIYDAVEEGNFSEAHDLLNELLKYADNLTRKKGYYKDYAIQMNAYSRSERLLYTSEIGYLIEQEDNSTNDRIIALLKEFSGHKIIDPTTIDDAQMTFEELVEYLSTNAVNLHKDELIEKFFTSAAAWSGYSAVYLLENNENASSILISSLSKLGSFPAPPADNVRRGDDVIDRINDYNEACMFLLNQAIMRKNKDLALQTQALIRDDLKYGNYSGNWYYSQETKKQAEEKINEAIEMGVFDE